MYNFRILCFIVVLLRVSCLVFLNSYHSVQGRNLIETNAVAEEIENTNFFDESDRFELTLAERARTTAEQGIAYGLALSTNSRNEVDVPFTSFADYVLDEFGRPVLLLKSDAEHSKNIAQKSNLVSVLLQARRMSRGGTSDGEYSSYAAAERCPRITISGELNPMSAEDASFVSGNFILEHAYAEPLLSEKSNQDFRLWRLEPSSVFYVGGFGVKAQWIDPSEYLKAKADIVASGAEALVHELNDEKHSADLEAATKHVLDIHDALKISVVHLDKLGVDFRVERKGNIVEEYRIKYRIPATSVEDAKSELNKLLQEAWEADNGLTFDGSYDVKPAVRKYAQSAS